MRRKVIFDVDEPTFKWLMGFTAMFQHGTGQALNMVIKEIREGGELQPERATVKYHAVGGQDALAALGERTIIGLIFAHLLEHGPKTNREIMLEKSFNRNTVEASIYRLRTQGLVESREID